MTKSHSEYFALGREGKVELLCEDRGNANGFAVRKFWVVNGAWEGQYAPALGCFTVGRTGATHATQLLWEGDEPPGRDYTEQIAWVQERVTHPLKVRGRAVREMAGNIWRAVTHPGAYRVVFRIEKKGHRPRTRLIDDEIPF